MIEAEQAAIGLGWVKIESDTRSVYQPRQIVRAIYQYAEDAGVTPGEVLDRWFQEHPENDLAFIRDITERAKRAMRERLS